MRTWWTSNPADKHGVHEYRPEDYGIDVDALRRQFAFYNDRFITPADDPSRFRRIPCPSTSAAACPRPASSS